MLENTTTVTVGFDPSYHNIAAKAETLAAQYGDIIVTCEKCKSRHVARLWYAVDVAEGNRDSVLLSKSCAVCREDMRKQLEDLYWESVHWEERIDKDFANDEAGYKREIAKFRSYHQKRVDGINRALSGGEKFSRMVMTEAEHKIKVAERERNDREKQNKKTARDDKKPAPANKKTAKK